MVYSLQVPFDRDGKSASKAAQLGISQQEVLDQWDAKGKEGKAIGIALHEHAGAMLRGQTQDTFEAMSTKSNHATQFDLFWAKASQVYTPIWIEIPVTSIHYMITGRVDALFYNKRNKTFHVIDWKSGSYSSEGWNDLKSPFDDLRDSTFNLGTIQTGIYKAVIQHATGIELDTSYLIHISDFQHTVLAMPDITPRITRWLEQEAKKRNGR